MGQIVGVISSPRELAHAAALRRPPDFFELRLDALYPVLPELTPRLARLRAPLIVTARHPAEGGRHQLSASVRRGLLLRFLPRAAFVDVELRSAAQFSSVLELAKARQIKRIISIHDLRSTPSLARLEERMRAAAAWSPDILKIVTRTESEDDWERLAAFFERAKTRSPLSAMGLGKFGRISRITLARHGSALNYVHLGAAQADGQLSLSEFRRLR